MRVLMVSEGPHEGSPRKGEHRPQALRRLVERVLPEVTELDWDNVRNARGTIHGRKDERQRSGYVRVAQSVIQHAARNGYDAVVLVLDEDGERKRSHDFEVAQTDLSRFLLPRALGIAIRTFDAWILADQVALAQACGKTIAQQPDPEDERDAKQRLRNLMIEVDFSGSQSELYDHVLRCADLQVLAKRCPDGFAPFLERLRRLAGEIQRG